MVVPIYREDIKRCVELFQILQLERSRKQPVVLANAVEEAIDNIQTVLDNLSPSQRGASILHPYIKGIEQQLAQLHSLSLGLKEPFMIFVVGMGKFGKSTLVNAILGGNYAEIDILPKTWKIDIFRAGSRDDLVSIRFHDGTEQEMSQEEAREFLRGEEQKREDSEDLIAQKFQEHAAKLSTIEEKEELLDMLHKEHLYQSQVAEVVYPCPVNALLENFLIVDTPGLWQEGILERSQEDIRAYYHKADGVLWLLDATKLATEKPQALLDDLEESFAAIGGRSDNIIGVVNRIDLVRAQSEDAVERVMEQARSIFGSRFLDIVPISSREALDGVLENNETLVRTSGLHDLLRKIDLHFLTGASSLKYESKRVGLERIIVDSHELMEQYAERLIPDLDRYEAFSNELKNRVKAFRLDVSKRLGDILSDYSLEVKNNISLYSARLFDFSEQERADRERFISQTIFQADLLDGRIKDEMRRIWDEFGRFGRSLLRDACFVEYKHLAKSQEPTIGSLAVHSPVYISAVSFEIGNEMLIGGVGAFLAGGALFGPIGALAALLLGATGVIKSIVVSFKKKRVEEVLLSHLSSIKSTARKMVIGEVNKWLSRIEEEAVEVAFKTFSELHGPPDQIESVMALIDVFAELRKEEIPVVDLAYLLGGERSA